MNFPFPSLPFLIDRFVLLYYSQTPKPPFAALNRRQVATQPFVELLEFIIFSSQHPLTNPLFAAMCRVVLCPACGSVDSRAQSSFPCVLPLALLRYFSFSFIFTLDRKCYYHHYHRHITPSITNYVYDYYLMLVSFFFSFL